MIFFSARAGGGGPRPPTEAEGGGRAARFSLPQGPNGKWFFFQEPKSSTRVCHSKAAPKSRRSLTPDLSLSAHELSKWAGLAGRQVAQRFAQTLAVAVSGGSQSTLSFKMAAINQQNAIYLLLALYSAYYYPRMLVTVGFMILAFSVHLVVVSCGFVSS